MVRLMKILLPAAAAVMVLVVLAWPRFAPPLSDPVSAEPGSGAAGNTSRLVMINPRYTGQDDQDRPFAIGAELAEPQGVNGAEILLTRPRADLVITDGVQVAATADRGRYLRRKELLILGGAVTLRRNSLYEVTTGEMSVDLEKGRAISHAGTTGKGEFGKFVADGLEILDQGKRIRLVGKSKMWITGGPSSDSGSSDPVTVGSGNSVSGNASQ